MKKRSLSMRSKNGQDRLSRLPEDIRSHILSLMPTKYAVRTSILSKTWRYNWMFVTNYYFDDVHAHNISSESIDRVMERCKASQIQLFRLHKTFYHGSNVASWIDKAVRLNVRVLDIRTMKFEEPLSLLTCQTLTELTLRCSFYNQRVLDSPPSVYLPCLKTLDVSVYSNLFDNAFKLVRGCPVLESLSLQVVISQDEEEYIFNIPTLKRFKLRVESARLINKVVLNVPNLEYLSVEGNLCSYFIMENVSSLVEASLSFLSFPNVTSHHLWVQLVKGLNGVKSLSAKNTRIDPNVKIPCISSLPVFLNMTHLELDGIWHPGLITQFLELSPQLKHLCIDNIPQQYFNVTEQIPEQFESTWIEPKLAPRMLTNLITIKYSIRTGKSCDIQILEYMLGNAEVLKTLTVIFSCLEQEEKRMRAHLLKVPRASRYCEIHFI